jgi:hypothetical protein
MEGFFILDACPRGIPHHPDERQLPTDPHGFLKYGSIYLTYQMTQVVDYSVLDFSARLIGFLALSLLFRGRQSHQCSLDCILRL